MSLENKTEKHLRVRIRRRKVSGKGERKVIGTRKDGGLCFTDTPFNPSWELCGGARSRREEYDRAHTVKHNTV